jgi:hypothetical protein
MLICLFIRNENDVHSKRVASINYYVHVAHRSDFIGDLVFAIGFRHHILPGDLQLRDGFVYPALPGRPYIQLNSIEPFAQLVYK